MKKIIFAIFYILSLNSMASISLTGTFKIDNENYNLILTYDLTPNQVASSKSVNYFASTFNSEAGTMLPAYCSYSMNFPTFYQVQIKKLSNQEVVYKKIGMEQFIGSADGGLYTENKCLWQIEGWSSEVSSLLRVSENYFELNNVSYRFIIDTYSKILVTGNNDLNLFVKSMTPKKGNDGLNDGEVWIDTEPTSDGNYQRHWFPLKL